MTDKPTEPTTEQLLRALGCSNNGCLVQERSADTVGTNATCSCHRRRTELDIQKILMLKQRQLKQAQARLDAALGLLKVARCPNCGGAYMTNNGPEQCQWCGEKQAALKGDSDG